MQTLNLETAKEIIKKIKADGFMIKGFCRVNKISLCYFYDVIKGDRGSSPKASPTSDAIIAILKEKGYLDAAPQPKEAV